MEGSRFTSRVRQGEVSTAVLQTEPKQIRNARIGLEQLAPRKIKPPHHGTLVSVDASIERRRGGVEEYNK